MKQIIDGVEYDTTTSELLAMDGSIGLCRTPKGHYFFAYKNIEGEFYRVDPIPRETAEIWLNIRGYKLPQKKKQKSNRDERIMLLLTPEEKEIVKRFTKKHNLVASRYIVRILMDHIAREDPAL